MCGLVVGLADSSFTYASETVNGKNNVNEEGINVLEELQEGLNVAEELTEEMEDISEELDDVDQEISLEYMYNDSQYEVSIEEKDNGDLVVRVISDNPNESDIITEVNDDSLKLIEIDEEGEVKESKYIDLNNTEEELDVSAQGSYTYSKRTTDTFFNLYSYKHYKNKKTKMKYYELRDANYIKNYVKNSGSNKTHISNFIKGVSKISKYGNKFKKAYSKKKIFPTILALLSAYESVATGTAVGAIVALLTAWNVTSTWIDCTLNIYYGEYQCYIASRSAKPLKRLP